MELENNLPLGGQTESLEQKPETPSDALPTGQPVQAEETKPEETTATVTPESKPAEQSTVLTAEEAEKIRRDQAAARQEAAQYRQKILQMAMQQELLQEQQAEAQASAKDKADVEAGLITHDEASQRQSMRQQAAQLAQMVKQLTPHAEQLGRIKLANDLATEYGINADDLLKDTTIQTPVQMYAKAGKLAIAKREDALRKATAKPESYDKGPGTPPPGPKPDEQRLKERYPSMYK